MPTLISRKTARQRMTTLMQTIATFVNVYDHQIKNFDGKSPVCMVYSDGSRTTFPDYTRQYHSLFIQIIWKREDGDATEDYIDDLANEVRQALVDNAEIASYWTDLDFDETKSEMGYFKLEGVQYRYEIIPVEVEVIA